MVTPDIHGCVRLDLVTGPPEKKYHPLGSGSSCCWIAWSHPLGSFFNNTVGDTVGANPCSSPCWTTHPGYCPLVVCSYVRRAEVVKLRGLEGLELTSFAVPMVPREVVSSDRPRGWITTTDPVSVVGDDNPRERVCETSGSGIAKQ